MCWLHEAGEWDPTDGNSAVTELWRRLNFHFDFKADNLLLA